MNLEAPQGYGVSLETLARSAPSSPTSSIPPLTLPSLSSRAFDFSGFLSNLFLALHQLSPGSDPKARHSFDPDGLSLAVKRDAAREFQHAVGELLVRRIQSCLDRLRRKRGLTVGSVVVSGGVASNRYLKERFVFFFLLFL